LSKVSLQGIIKFMQDTDKINTQNTNQGANLGVGFDQNIQDEVYKLEKQYGVTRGDNANKSIDGTIKDEDSGIVKKISELEKESGIVDTEIKSKEEEVKNRLAEIQGEIKRLNELKTIGQKITEKKARLKELDEMEKKIKEETDNLKEEAETRLSQKAGGRIGGIMPIIFGVIFIASQIFLFSQKVEAQINQYSIIISSIPTSPGPNEDATISISSITEDLDSDKITWTVDGKEIASDFGKKSISITTKGVGEASIIKAKVELGEEEITEKSITIYPAGIDIFWEGADAYAPPFYKGRVLAGVEAMIRVVAIPFLNKDGIDSMGSGGFTYKWSRNLNPSPNASGYGQSAFVFKSSLLEVRESIGVSVFSSMSQASAEGLSIIIPGKPFILFYEKDSGLGIKYEQALSSLNIFGRTASILAEPFFFSANPLNRDLTYSWKINDSTTSPQKNKNELFIASGTGEGSASISLNIESRSKLFQSANAGLTVFLNKQ